MERDVLEVVPAEKIPELVEVLKRDLPLSAMVINWLRVQSSWQALIPGVQLMVLCPSSNWRSGTVVGLARGGELGDRVFAAMFATSDEAGCSELAYVLLTSQLVPWSSLEGLLGVLEVHEPIVLAALAARGLGVSLSAVDIYHMPAHQAVQIPVPKPPPEAQLISVHPHFEDEVCHLWVNFTEQKRPLVRAMLRHNRSSGLQVAGRLASLVLESHYGGLGLLTTDPAFYGRGYASLVLASLTRDLGQTGDDSVILVSPKSEGALRITNKLGFVQIAKGSFVNVFIDLAKSS